MKTQSKLESTTKSRASNKRLILKFLIAGIFLLVGMFVLQDALLRNKFAALSYEIEKVQQDVMAPAGAVKQPKLSSSGGNGLLASFDCWPDTLCPFARDGWMVPLEGGSEGELARSILENQGYTFEDNVAFSCVNSVFVDGCAQEGTKGDRHMRINIFIADPRRQDIPEKDITPRTWRYIDVYVADYRSPSK